jgi:hypothetical protein
MKKISILIMLGGLLFMITSCTKDFEDINKDPNNPSKVTTGSLLTNAQKSLMDDMRDEWFSGRQGLVYAQYITQRNYTSEDRYSIRQSTNNTYWRLIYTDIMDLQEIIRLNTDPSTNVEASLSGSNNNQIAIAKVLKVYAFQVLTDIYGDIPYLEAFQVDKYPNPKYTAQSDIYADLIKELTDASNMIDISGSAFGDNDVIYGGDMEKWKKFANSLKMRVALRTSKVPGSNYLTQIQEAVDAGVFTSNDDNAIFKYVGSTPNNAPMFDAYFTSKPFVDLLKGQNDTLNSKVNPFNGLVDPRINLFARPNSGAKGNFYGMPYGMSDAQTNTYWKKKLTPNYLSYPTLFNAADYACVFMTYAEVCFIQSEINGWDDAWYKKGVASSLSFWKDQSYNCSEKDKDVLAVYDSLATVYKNALPLANEENVLTQKYINNFNDGQEAWAEYRRTGFPKVLIKPGEVTYNDGTKNILFTPLVDVGTDIVKRVTYPIDEQTLNKVNYDAAAEHIGGDAMGTALWWDK